MSTRTTITRRDAEKALAALTAQAGAWIDGNGVAPKIVENFDWLGSGHPAPFAIVWEEGPYNWTYLFPFGGIEEEFGFRLPDVSDQLPGHLFAEAITGWAVGLYLN